MMKSCIRICLLLILLNACAAQEVIEYFPDQVTATHQQEGAGEGDAQENPTVEPLSEEIVLTLFWQLLFAPIEGERPNCEAAAGLISEAHPKKRENIKGFCLRWETQGFFGKYPPLADLALTRQDAEDYVIFKLKTVKSWKETYHYWQDGVEFGYREKVSTTWRVYISIGEFGIKILGVEMLETAE